jgi:ribosome-binding protein aMBF1 (putative translation factor)
LEIVKNISEGYQMARRVGRRQPEKTKAQLDARTRIAWAVVAIRSAQRLSQRALAKQTGLSVSTIRRIEQARAPMRIDTLAALATGLGVPVEHLVQRLTVH